MSSFFDAYVDGIIAMLDQSDSIEVRVNASADIVDLDIALLPRAGSNLGKFADAQHPSTYPLLAKLPAASTGTTMTMAGHVALGPYSAAARKTITDVMVSFFKTPDEAGFRKTMDAWFDAVTGELAANATMGGGQMQMTELIGVAPGGDAWAKMKTLMATLYADGPHTIEFGNLKENFGGTIDSSNHDGVAISEMTASIDTTALDPAMKAAIDANPMTKNGMHLTMAGWDDVVGMNMGADPNAGMASLIDGYRGKAPTFAPTGGIGSMIDSSRKRGDSALMLMDYTAFIRQGMMAAHPGVVVPEAPANASGIMFALGCPKGQLHVHLGVPVEQVTAIMSMAAPH